MDSYAITPLSDSDPAESGTPAATSVVFPLTVSTDAVKLFDTRTATSNGI